ncbi:MAG: hypothetical protein V1775_08485 [Bacteroidota bacterium]
MNDIEMEVCDDGQATRETFRGTVVFQAAYVKNDWASDPFLTTRFLKFPTGDDSTIAHIPDRVSGRHITVCFFDLPK